MEMIPDVEKRLIDYWRGQALRAENKTKIAQGRLYDLIYTNKPEPMFFELKAKILDLEVELKKVIDQRDKLKSELREVRKSDDVNQKVQNM